MTAQKFDPRRHVITLHGKPYLEVKHRIQWFRSDHPRGAIQTQRCEEPGRPLMFRASIYDSTGSLLATAHAGVPKSDERAVWTGREAEKAETAAIGRALGHAGYLLPDLASAAPAAAGPTLAQRPHWSTNPDAVQALLTRAKKETGAPLTIRQVEKILSKPLTTYTSSDKALRAITAAYPGWIAIEQPA
jgi:hypothetical protein